MTTQLFSVPILSTPKTGEPPTGVFVCTSPAKDVYLLTFTAPPDNRLLTGFIQAFLLSLDIIEFSYPPGVVITTSGIPKFYSNGLDLEHATGTEGFFSNSLYTLWKRLITYPMPTIALLNGHAFAGGLMTAMYHDYRVFNPSRGFLCLNELDFGVPLRAPMSSIFRQKTTPQTYRSLVVEAKRFGGKEALDAGLVDVLGGLEEALTLVNERKLTTMPKTGIYGLMKMEMFRETLIYLDTHDKDDELVKERLNSEDERTKEGKKRVAQWEKNYPKAKL